MTNAKGTHHCDTTAPQGATGGGSAFRDATFVISSSFVIRISSFSLVSIRVHSWLMP
jgi:hypothetical protein